MPNIIFKVREVELILCVCVRNRENVIFLIYQQPLFLVHIVSTQPEGEEVFTICQYE